MSRVSEMSLEEILKETDIIMRNTDIDFIYDDEKEREIAKAFKEKFKDSSDKRDEIKKFLIDSEKKIAQSKRGEKKERLVLLIIRNYIENTETIKRYLARFKEEFVKTKSPELISNIAKFDIQLKQQEENLAKALKIGKGIKQIIVYYFFDEKENRYKVDIVDSRKLIDGKKVDASKNLRRFNKIDQDFMDENSKQEIGFEYIIQSLLLTDLSAVFENEQLGNTARLGDNIRAMILENVALDRKIITRKELDIINATDEKHADFVDNIPYDTEALPKVKATLREYIQYVDIDKLLLVAAYRFNEFLENGEVEEQKQAVVKEILQGIYENIKTDRGEITCELQNKKNLDAEQKMKITYSKKDIKQCISQFAEGQYLSTKQIEEYREKVNSQEINLSEIPYEYIDVIFSQNELEDIATLSVENLICVSLKDKWDDSKVIELYEENKISLEHLKVLQDRIDLSNYVSFEVLNSYYIKLKENPDDEENVNRYERYLELYKEMFINGKDKNEIEEDSTLIVEGMVEIFEERDFEEAVKNYYKEGIITLDSITEWCNETFIKELYNEGLITLDDVTQLVKDNKLPYEYLHQIYSNLINNKDLSYNERLELIKKGFVKEEEIFDLYKRNLIFEEDLKQLAEDGIVKKREMQRIVNSRTLEELEKNSSIRLTGLNSLAKKNNDIYYDRNNGITGQEKTKSTGKFIIDPNERERFIRLLKAYRANTDLNEESPFYNYEFYVIPDESGTIGLNSVVIAERYYEDKDTERKFATDNATYFFKYKDLIVLSNLRKSEMTKERENIVFTANHVIANEKREGRWAKSVISNIAKTMMSCDLKEYSKKNQKIIIMRKLQEIYTPQELSDILNMATEIDFGEYIGEIEEPIENTSRRKKNGPRVKRPEDISDDAESR